MLAPPKVGEGAEEEGAAVDVGPAEAAARVARAAECGEMRR